MAQQQPFHIEQATWADIDELIELRLGYLADDFGALSDEERVSLPQEIRPYLQEHLGRDLRVFLSRVNEGDTSVPGANGLGPRGSAGGCIASCAWLLLVEKPPSPRFPHGRTGVLFNVYTRPEYRRQGFARRVMGTLIDAAREHGLDVLELHATDDGYPLYQSLGFADDSSTHLPMRMMLV